MTNLVLDANVFLHARFFNEIPWNELVKDDVCIVLTSVVLAELDKAKYAGPSDATKQRARKVVARILEIHEERQGAVREGVALKVSLVPARREGPLNVDPSNQDSQVLAECVAIGGECQLCTLDTGMLLRAKSHGVQVLRLPSEFLAPPVGDAPKREGADRGSAPRLVVVPTSGGRPLLEGDAVTVTTLRPPTSEEVELKALGELADARRRARVHRSELMEAWDAEYGRNFDDDEERQSQEERQFLARKQDIYRRAREEAQRAREVPVVLTIRNEGTRAANNLVIELVPDEPLEVVGEARLTASRVMHNLSETLPELVVRFPSEFAAGGTALTVRVHCDELPKPTVHRLNLRVVRVTDGPFTW